MKQAPNPNEYRDRWCGDLTASDAGSEVRVAGWVHTRRDHGGLIFVDLRDRSGITQIVFNPEVDPDAHEKAKQLRSEDVIAVRGVLSRRPAETLNPELATGEVELLGKELRL